ncbi:peptide deformylase [Lactiplantibacillus plantarum]|uniref:peptide deformylase n=1 Tax=Lactiplantibacillus plantarum TaxID=1590 RepID=UPI0022386576|nr:peptide deformylase [Lactiplantibacillus plantarum]MCW6148882.1 peptide deformylase [Lactiplantibacillus plantarum]
MIRPIVHDPAALSVPADLATPADTQVLTDLLDTLTAHTDNCVGMAANMIGVNKQIIVVQLGPFAIAMINPKIIDHHGTYETKEGCLSLPGERPTSRYHQITVKYKDQHFKPQQQRFNDFTAQIIQHELDHCAGKLI